MNRIRIVSVRGVNDDLPGKVFLHVCVCHPSKMMSSDWTENNIRVPLRWLAALQSLNYIIHRPWISFLYSFLLHKQLACILKVSLKFNKKFFKLNLIGKCKWKIVSSIWNQHLFEWFEINMLGNEISKKKNWKKCHTAIVEKSAA